MSVVIKTKRGTTEQWNNSTTPLQIGELGLDTTLNKLKAGNGTSLWEDLPFLTSDGGGDTGNITFDGVQIIGAGTASGDGYGNGTIELVPDADINTDQYLIIDPTAPNHIHIRGGGTQDASGADVFIGGERNNVRVSDGGRSVSVSTRPQPTTNTYTNMNSQSANYFVVANTAEIYVGDTGYYSQGGDLFTVNSITPDLHSPGTLTIAATSYGTPTTFIGGGAYVFIHEEEWENYWQFGADGVLHGPGGGTLIVSGISGEPGDDVFAIVADQNLVLQHGVGGAYLNDSTIANNHIATMGDILDANDYTDTAISTLGDTIDSGYIPITEKGTAGGVASLDLSGKVPLEQIDASSFAGATGPTGPTGPTGDDGFVAQTDAPTNTSLLWLDTDEVADNLNLGTTSSPGILQLTDSTSSTSTTTAATPNSVKTAYDSAVLAQNFLDPLSGFYYRTPTNSVTTTGTGNVASTNVTYYTPVQFSKSVTLDRIAINTNFTGFSGTALVRLGIFANTNGKPGALILDAGTVAPIAAATSYAITISQALSAGIYWVAMNTITAATTNVYYSVGNNNNNNNILFGGALASGNSGSSGAMGFTQSYTATSEFANAGTVSVTAFTPLTYVRVA